jgi:hypothetical protein
MFPKEMFKDEVVRVVHSQEEFDSCVAQGWSDVREAGKTYKPLSAVTPAKPAKGHAVGDGDAKAKAAEAEPAPEKPKAATSKAKE